jgi:hypothetical protein
MKQEYIFSLGMGISMVFEILGHCLFMRGQDDHVQSGLTYHQMLFDTRNKNIYGLGFGISKILGTSFLRGDGTTACGHDLHAILCSLTQGTRIYKQFRDEFKLNKDIKESLYCAPTQPRGR